MKVAVVILNWNGKKFLEQFLPAVIEHTGNDADIIIADNASSDNSLKYLREKHPHIRIIQHHTNKGFAQGYNEALKQVKAEYFILLNSDIEVSPNWINPVIHYMDAHPEVGACQPKIRSYHEPAKFEYAGAAGGFIDKFGYPFCRGRIFMHLEEDKGQFDDSCEIFWATGACMFVRAKLFNQCGGFDEDFFAHMEEIDFCWRLKLQGHKIMYIPHSTVFHVGGGTLPKQSSHKTYLNMRNNILMLYKNLPRHQLLPVLAARWILDGVAAFKFLISSGFGDFWAVLRAHIYIYQHLQLYTRKRRQLKHLHKPSQMYGGLIVVDHFLKGKKRFIELAKNKFYR